ncbi:hypothetical protein BGP77_13450 [Saccharospirillum sp. MSK14-1]|nr:hypothetical protein BGP77_13450 [Saccharospirillum sp. MSK14-1]
MVVLVCQGALQYWHAPVHLAEQMQAALIDIDQVKPGLAVSDRDIHANLDDLTDCQSCNLLKLSQLGALALHRATLPTMSAPMAQLSVDESNDQRLTEPAARGPPRLSSIPS